MLKLGPRMALALLALGLLLVYYCQPLTPLEVLSEAKIYEERLTLENGLMNGTIFHISGYYRENFFHGKTKGRKHQLLELIGVGEPQPMGELLWNRVWWDEFFTHNQSYAVGDRSYSKTFTSQRMEPGMSLLKIDHYDFVEWGFMMITHKLDQHYALFQLDLTGIPRDARIISAEFRFRTEAYEFSDPSQLLLILSPARLPLRDFTFFYDNPYFPNGLHVELLAWSAKKAGVPLAVEHFTPEKGFVKIDSTDIIQTSVGRILDVALVFRALTWHNIELEMYEARTNFVISNFYFLIRYVKYGFGSESNQTIQPVQNITRIEISPSQVVAYEEKQSWPLVAAIGCLALSLFLRKR